MYIKNVLSGLSMVAVFCLLCVQGVMQAQAQSEDFEEAHVTVYCNTPTWYVDPVTNESFVEIDIMADSSQPLTSAHLQIAYPSDQVGVMGVIEGDTLPLPMHYIDEKNSESSSVLHYYLGTDARDNHISGDGLWLATIYLKANERLDANVTLITFEHNENTRLDRKTYFYTLEEGHWTYDEWNDAVLTINNCDAGANVDDPQTKSIDDITALFPETPQPDQTDPTLATMDMSHVYCDVPIETVMRDGEPAVGIKIWADIPQSEQINQHALWLGYDVNAYEYIDVEENSLFSFVSGKGSLATPFTDEIDVPAVLENIDAYSGVIAYMAGAPGETHWGKKVLLATVYLKPLLNDTTISPLSLITPPQGERYEERGTTTYNVGRVYPVTVGECNDTVVTLRSGRFSPETMSDNAEELPTQVGLQSQSATTTTVTLILVLVTSLGASTLWLSKHNIA